MAINIERIYSTTVEITFTANDNREFKEIISGSIDDIAEYCGEVLVKREFTHAEACSVETGEIIMILTRT